MRRQWCGYLRLEAKAGSDDVKRVITKPGHTEIFSICACIFGSNF